MKERLLKLWDSTEALRFQSSLCLSLPHVLETLSSLISLSSWFPLPLTHVTHCRPIAILFAASSLAVDHFPFLSSSICRENWVYRRQTSHVYLTLPTGLLRVMPETVTFFSFPSAFFSLHSYLHAHFLSGFCSLPISWNGECSHLIFLNLSSGLSTRSLSFFSSSSPPSQMTPWISRIDNEKN